MVFQRKGLFAKKKKRYELIVDTIGRINKADVQKLLESDNTVWLVVTVTVAVVVLAVDVLNMGS